MKSNLIVQRYRIDYAQDDGATNSNEVKQLGVFMLVADQEVTLIERIE